MTYAPAENLRSNQTELFLSRTYERIRRITIVLGIGGAMVAALWFGWRSALGLAVGTAVGLINLIWLHRGSEMMIDRMLAPARQAPSKLRLVAAFTARYIFVLAIAYVIVERFPTILLGFAIGLFLPILAATCEGIYEAFLNA